MVNAIVTLLFTSSYLSGALVLGQTIRQLGLPADTKLVVLLAASLTDFELSQLSEVYDEILETELIHAKTGPELTLLNRPELSPTFSKINIFKLTQFDQVLYLDSDTLPIQDLTHLFDEFGSTLTEDDIVAAPDSGWPDIFNSGLFLVKPSITTYQNLLSKIHNVSKAPSFDGADQGLLNEYYTVDETTPGKTRSWTKLPFVYNVTPSGQYQYQPAYHFFQDRIKLVHFIGAIKPWDSDRSGERYRWWDKFHEFYGHGSVKELIHGIKPKFYIPPPAEETVEPSHYEEQSEPSYVEEYHHVEEVQNNWAQFEEANQVLNNPQSYEIFETVQPDQDQWDPARDEPPMDGKPQAAEFPDLGHYYNEWDTNQEEYGGHEHHEEYVEAYEESAPTFDEHPVPEEEWKPPPIFPWEFQEEQHKAERVFVVSDEYQFDDASNLPVYQRIKKHHEKAAQEAQERASRLAEKEEENEKESARRKSEVEKLSEEVEVGVVKPDFQLESLVEAEPEVPLDVEHVEPAGLDETVADEELEQEEEAQLQPLSKEDILKLAKSFSDSII